MLETLVIENVALVESATLEFDSKLNVISGETGAGKSIVLDSLGFVFGGRADKTMIRVGADKMKVTAVFAHLSTADILMLKDLVGDGEYDELFVSRELNTAGKNVCKINGELVPLAVQKKVCSHFVDIHGQSEHLAILSNDYQLEIVDLFEPKTAKSKSDLNDLIDKVNKIDDEINLLGGNEKDKQNLIDLYTFQIGEIETCSIGEHELEDLIQERDEMRAYEKICNNLGLAHENISGDGGSEGAVDKLFNASKSLNNLSALNEKYLALGERLNSALIEVQDIQSSIDELLENLSFDEKKLDDIEARIDEIKNLFRKYGGGYTEMRKYLADTKTKLSNLLNSDEKYKELCSEKEKLLNQIEAVQEGLSLLRKASAKALSSALKRELKALNMPNVEIAIQFNVRPEQYTRSGKDAVEFMFSANAGFEPKPLNKVVSGGEMSRVMLAYKIVVSQVDNIHTIVFDEIDTGLSGSAAKVVAEYMARLSAVKQIIAVSHLPQICAMADRNIKVEKFSKSQTTYTNAKVVEGNELYAEIGRLMGLSESASLDASEELKKSCTLFKTTIRK